MLLSKWNKQDEEALKNLYSTGQHWSWEQIERRESGGGEKIADWIDTHPEPRRNPLILPIRRSNPDGNSASPSWVALSFSDKQAEELRELLNSFIGSAHSDYNGRLGRLQEGDPLSKTICEWTGGENRFFEFQALAKDDRAKLAESLQRLKRVLAFRPRRTVSNTRTTEALLREFHSALYNKDETATDRWKTELKESGRLSQENILFLDFERLAVFERWDQMIHHAHWHALIRTRRPQQVTLRMIEALWHIYIEAIAQDNDPDKALAVMRERVLEENLQLFRAKPTSQKPTVIIMMMLAAVAANPPRAEQIDPLLAQLPEGYRHYPFAKLIAQSHEPAPSPAPSKDLLTLAREAIDAYDFWGAYEKLVRIPPTRDSCRRLLECTPELELHDRDDGSEIAEKVADALSALDETDHQEVLKTTQGKRAWKEIQRVIDAPEGADSWESWFDLVQEDPATFGNLEDLDRASQNWSIQRYREEPQLIDTFIEHFDAGYGSSACHAIQKSLPYIARFFEPEGIPEAAFIKVYIGILQALSLSDFIGTEDWGMTERLATSAFEVGLTPKGYGDVVESITTFWRERGELRKLDWALDRLDHLITAPAPQPDRRNDFFGAVFESLQTYYRRISPHQRLLFHLLCHDLERLDAWDTISEASKSIPEADTAEDSTQIPLSEKIVGIYSLDESPTKRAKKILEDTYSGIDVRLSHEHAGTNQLKSLSTNAHYFVVVTQSAKHAATEFIKMHRSDDSGGLIYPVGRGAASIVSALESVVRAEMF